MKEDVNLASTVTVSQNFLWEESEENGKKTYRNKGKGEKKLNHTKKMMSIFLRQKTFIPIQRIYS